MPSSVTSKLKPSESLSLTTTTASTQLKSLDPDKVATAATTRITMSPNQTQKALTNVGSAPFTGPLAPLNFVTEVASRLLGLVGLGPSMAGSPAAPAQAPVLWTLLAWARREIGQTLFGGSAVASAQPTLASLVQGPNLLVNPGAEAGDPSLSGYSSVTVPGWAVTGVPTVIDYGTQRRYPWPTGSPGPTFPSFLGFPATAPAGAGSEFFGGGNVATSTLTQTVNLGSAAADIDAGAVPYTLSGLLGGFFLDPSRASVTVNFLDANKGYLGAGQIGPVTAFDRLFQTGLQERDISGVVPVGTRSAQVVVTFTDLNPVLGNYNNAYADNISLTVGAPNLAPAPLVPPASTVGDLDHVFLIYMENKGYTDIVGSPNAPYLNSLINAYGVGSNYFALTHPSDPNYTPILGGSDFGLNYNCPANCIDAINLADNIDGAQKTWAGYMVGGGGYSTPTDRLPFLNFSDIYNNDARVQSHLFDISKLATDLNSALTTPNFVWIGADDATNMEGPTDTLDGILSWALSQLTNHQYNVKAGDQWLHQTIPTILNSPVWQDPTQKSAIFITFDEDYNNISLGIGNQGNNIPMVVIPSPGAVQNGGMRPGHFTVTDYGNHYSLLRTIEDSLGVVTRLTDNDTYAYPLNGYWL